MLDLFRLKGFRLTPKALDPEPLKASSLNPYIHLQPDYAPEAGLEEALCPETPLGTAES